jgi:hypothetical protein
MKNVLKSYNLGWAPEGHACLYIILAIREAEIRKITGRSHPRQIVRETLENTQYKTGLAEWLEWLKCLPSNREVLSSNTSTAKTKTKNPKSYNLG